MCKERGQTWSGSAPRCAFESGVFSSDNWNCATANALRELSGERNWQTKEKDSLWLRRNDQSFAAMWVPAHPEDVPDGDRCGPFRGGGFIAMTWYKHRGQTEMILRVDPRDGGTVDKCGLPLTIAEAEAAIENIRLARDHERR